MIFERLARYTGITVVAFSLALIGGCSSENTDDASGSGLQVSSVSVSPAQVSVGATTVVEAIVTNNGTPTSNQVVTFSVSPSTAGTFAPTSATTDNNGIAATVFTANNSGSVNLTASVANGGSRNAALSIQSAQQTGSGNVSMNVSNSLLLADGASQSTVTITVRDAQSNPAPNGTIVKIAAGERFVDKDGNGYWSPGVDSLVYDGNGNGTWDAIGNIPSSATVAGGAGAAVVTYTAGTIATTVYVKATVEDASYAGYNDISLQLTPNATINSIWLDADTIHLAVKSTGGFETTTLRAWCFDENGNPVPEGISVTFSIVDGPGGGENLANLGYGPYTAITNSQGIATAPLSSGTISGTVRMRATDGGSVLSNGTQVVINAGPPVEITVGIDTCNTRMWRVVNGRVGVVAVVRDVYRNPVADSTAVWFTTDEGQVAAQQGSTTDNLGVARSTWISGYDGTGHDGVVWVYAETAGGTVFDSVSFYNSDFVDSIALVGFPNSLVIDGESSGDFTVQLFDFHGNPVINGLVIDDAASYLQVILGLSKNQCFGSFATGEVSRGAPLQRDYSLTGGNDDGIGAVDMVTISCENGSITVPCTLTTGPSYSKNSTIDDLDASIDGGQVAVFGCTVADRFGNPLGDHTVVANATAGSIANGTQNTNGYGEAYNFQFTAPTDTTIRSVYITVTDTDPLGNGMVLSKKVTINHQ